MTTGGLAFTFNDLSRRKPPVVPRQDRGRPAERPAGRGSPVIADCGKLVPRSRLRQARGGWMRRAVVNQGPLSNHGHHRPGKSGTAARHASATFQSSAAKDSFGSRTAVFARLMVRPVCPQLRKCRVRPGSYAWCQEKTSSYRILRGRIAIDARSGQLSRTTVEDECRRSQSGSDHRLDGRSAAIEHDFRFPLRANGRMYDQRRIRNPLRNP